MFECRCDDEARRGLRVETSKGRIMHICDSCQGWWYEGYSGPIITSQQATRKQLPDLPEVSKMRVWRNW